MSDRADELAAGGSLGRRTVVHRFALWPFGTRTVQLYLLIDPSTRHDVVEEGLLRSMQAEFFRTESCSQTRALRQSLMAANYVLHDHNQEALPHKRVYASAACAVVRGSSAYVALLGETAAFALNGKRLASQRAGGRVARPLGLEEQPKVQFWSASLAEGDRIALVCGPAWQDSTLEDVARLLTELPAPGAESALSHVLAGPDGPARVLVAEPEIRARTVRGHAPTGADERIDTATQALARTSHPARDGAPGRRWQDRRRDRPVGPARAGRPRPRSSVRSATRLLVGALTLSAFLLVGTFALGRPLGEAPYSAWAREAETLLQQAEQARDAFTARELAAQAEALASRAATAEPATYAPLLSRAKRVLRDADRAYEVRPTIVVMAGERAPGIAELAIGPDVLFALDLPRGEVRQFSLNRAAQRWEDGQVVATRGTNAGDGTLEAPIAMTWLRGGGEGLAVIDQAGKVALFTPRGGLRLAPSRTGPAWQSVSAVAPTERGLSVLDGQAGAYHVYPVGPLGPAAAPALSLTASQAPELSRVPAVEMVPLSDLYLRTAQGEVVRLDPQGNRRPFGPKIPGGNLGPVASIAPDGAGGLYLADPANGRIVHVAGDGRFVRQLRAAEGQSLAGVRSLQTSADGRRIVGMVGSDLVSIAVPAEVPVPLEGSSSSAPEPSGTRVAK